MSGEGEEVWGKEALYARAPRPTALELLKSVR